jgi:hypothetical protein
VDATTQLAGVHELSEGRAFFHRISNTVQTLKDATPLARSESIPDQITENWISETAFMELNRNTTRLIYVALKKFLPGSN